MMRAMVALMCGILMLGSGWPAMALDLPPDVRADQYLLEATEALEQGDPKTAIRAFEKIEALDTEPPMEFLFFYGKLLVENSTAVEGVRKGHALLKQFVINAEKTSEHYRPTLKLLSVAERKIEAAERRRIEAAMLLENRKQQMVTVQGDTFTMGCTEQSGCFDNEKPAHQVQVNSFLLSKYEVTQELWKAVMGKNPSDFQGCARCPVDSVNWEDVQVFLKKLNALTGERYRLPTEAEWEYAARGGQRTRGYQYVGSDDVDAVAWYNKNSGDKTHPVGQKAANELGLYDMSGNVKEWVQDCWHNSCDRGRVRGGSWYNNPSDLRDALRSRFFPGNSVDYCYCGFRIAQTLTP